MSNTTPIDDGGAAFPRPAGPVIEGDVCHESQRGMTLRDWFAGQALIGLLSQHVTLNPQREHDMRYLSEPVHPGSWITPGGSMDGLSQAVTDAYVIATQMVGARKENL